MTLPAASAARAARAGRARRELAVLVLAGAAGAGAAILAARQDLGRVIVRAPRPLPAAVTSVTAQDVRPAIAALAVAALTSLAAVLATRGLPRRLTGLITMALGTGIAVLAALPVTRAEVLAAASAAGSAPASGVGAGGAAGSVTSGGGPGPAGGPGSITGFPAHVVLAGPGWRALVVACAALVVAAGAAVVIRAARLPAMSARYDRARRGPAPLPQAGPARAGTGARSGGRPAADSMWESLSAGGDPTTWPE